MLAIYYGVVTDTLSQIADSLDKLNQDGLKAVLEIYTDATVTEELRKKLDKNTSSHIMGSRSYKGNQTDNA